MILLTVDLSVSIYFQFLLLQSQGTANFLLFFFFGFSTDVQKWDFAIR